MKKLPSPITILMVVILIAAAATWLIPAGNYDTVRFENDAFIYKTRQGETPLPFLQSTLDSLGIKVPKESFATGAIRKPLSVPGTFHRVSNTPQGLIKILQAPVKGIYEAIDIVFFILVLGGFMNIFNSSGAMVKGLAALSFKMKGRESWLIIILTFLFSFGGSSYGMAEEAIAFYPVLVPLFLAAGYDLLVPVAVIFAGTQLGTLSSFSNPFSTIIASNAAGITWTDGLAERIIIFVLTTAATIFYIERYASRVKADPSRSLVLRTDGVIVSPYPAVPESAPEKLSVRNKLLLFVFLATFLVMIGGVVFYDWWLLEMTSLFVFSTLLMAVIIRLNEKEFLAGFISGAADLLNVALIVGIARGVTIILNDGNISDSIVYYAASFSGNMPPALFIIILFILYILFTLFISSSSGMAVLTMPVMGSLATLVHVPSREIVNAYLFGMGIMGFLTPTGLILPSLALVNVSFKAWWKFIYPLLIILFLICGLCLMVGILL